MPIDIIQTKRPKEGSVVRYIARKSDKGWVVAFGRVDEQRDQFLEGEVPFREVEARRRIRHEDLMAYKLKTDQKRGHDLLGHLLKVSHRIRKSGFMRRLK